MTMIERVAKAICADSATLDWREYREEARRAIEAMREPTRAMWAAVDVNKKLAETGQFTTDDLYRCLIDAALTESGT